MTALTTGGYNGRSTLLVETLGKHLGLMVLLIANILKMWPIDETNLWTERYGLCPTMNRHKRYAGEVSWFLRDSELWS